MDCEPGDCVPEGNKNELTLRENESPLLSIMENTDNNQQIEEKLQAEEEKLLAAARKKIEKGRDARRAKIAERMQKRATSSQMKAEQKAKAKEIVANSGFKNAVQLLKAILPALPYSVKRKLQTGKTRRGPGNGLTAEERAEITRLRQEGVPASKIADKFNISINTVYIASKK